MGTADRRWPTWKVCYFAGMVVLIGLAVWIFVIGFLWPGAYQPF